MSYPNSIDKMSMFYVEAKLVSVIHDRKQCCCHFVSYEAILKKHVVLVKSNLFLHNKSINCPSGDSDFSQVIGITDV